MKISTILSLIVILALGSSKVTAQSATFTCPSNIIIKADNNMEGATVVYPEFITNADWGTIIYSPASGSFFRLGSHTVTMTSSRGQKCSFTVTVTDTQSPVLSEIKISPKNLWPASNKMKKVSVNYTATDNAQEVTTELFVSSNAIDGVADWEIIDNHLLKLKATRLPDGTPRVYIITVTATDKAGNTTTRTTSIAVSKTMMAVASM
ncbi:MAG: HYR domain-containing protein [Chitinophagaceae bacterium]|nr:HYR domain-containing protein [Chitinophagaceae bacterium]MBK7678904.1 HYR domain-containing protein [Chitinophagaceae bacterium]MBK8299751.1 HYR domain-containing protein [Chitinophagaceae bacterium]MBK9463800.1 HYR domain-containing protein [Chitinophagaceae bacterium]MBK9659085.1 HYR domain-containing protein [Chitinophagaceae bacterium]